MTPESGDTGDQDPILPDSGMLGQGVQIGQNLLCLRWKLGDGGTAPIAADFWFQ